MSGSTDGGRPVSIRLEAVAEPFAGAGDVLAVPVHPGDDGAAPGRGADAVAGLGVDAAALLGAREATGSAGEVTEVPVSRDGVRSVLLVGVGDGSPAALRKAGSAVARRAAGGTTIAATVVDGTDDEAARAFAEAAALAAYSFSRRSSEKPRTLTALRLVVDAPRRLDAALAAAGATADAVHLARDLAQTPSMEKSPQWMADRAQAIARDAELAVTVWDEQRLAADGFGGILAVGRGSARPPRLVQLEHRPPRATEHVVLVGKGITFDTGGLSLKPLDGMKAMKTDMAGAAAVLATMSALSRLGVRRRVTALLPLAENMPGAAATRPGDVIRQWGGRSVEVLNTDAEGRLVLADALAYAVARLSPDAIIDVATLTGAITLGLGRRHAGLYSTSPALERALVEAGAAGGERLWPMPLVEDYRNGLDSPIADLRNIGDPDHGYQGGSIVAALFLREFVHPPGAAAVPWAHLDIAGVGRADADEDEVTKGPTGFGVRTFLRYLSA
jgi:leucyl aminopeptidase